MAVNEQTVLFRGKDVSGSSTLIYPITKADNVDGLEESVSYKITEHNSSNAAHEDIRADISDLSDSLANKADTEHSHSELVIANDSRGARVSLTSDVEGIYYLLPESIELYQGEVSDNAFYLGSPNNKWNNIYSDNITATNLNGTATKATGDGNGNNIANTYETKTDASSKLSDAKTYTDLKTSGLASTSSVISAINTHNTSSSSHNDIRELITDLAAKLNNFLDVDDTTTDQLSEVITLINNNKGTLESLTTSKVNVSDIVNNLTTNISNKPLSSAQGVVIKSLIDALQKEIDSHSHSISDVSGLQSALDSKAASSHGTHVTYSATAPVMDGTASVGSASTVARSDHKHPTDTTRASKTEFDSHVSDTAIHMTSNQKNQLNTAYNHSQESHAPSNAEKNQNAFSNITVGSTTVAADSTTDTVTFVGSNITITPDAANDRITFAVSDGSTSTKGLVKLTNSTTSTSTTTAATPSSVKQAYDLANSANSAATNVSNELSKYMPLDGGIMAGDIDMDGYEIFNLAGISTQSVTLSNGSEPVIISTDEYGGGVTLTSSDKQSIFIAGVAEPTNDDMAANKKYVDNVELITVADIDTICGSSIVSASEVSF